MRRAAVTWHVAARGDRLELQSFECTPGGSKRRVGGRYELVAPFPSERAVQSLIRSSLKPPCPKGEYVVLGRDEVGICAVGFLLSLAEPGYFQVRVVAVALRRRGDGARLGDQLLDHLLNEATAQALAKGVEMMVVSAHIGRDNGPSKALFSRFGFGHLYEVNDKIELWGTKIPIAGAEVEPAL